MARCIGKSALVGDRKWTILDVILVKKREKRVIFGKRCVHKTYDFLSPYTRVMTHLKMTILSHFRPIFIIFWCRFWVDFWTTFWAVLFQNTPICRLLTLSLTSKGRSKKRVKLRPFWVQNRVKKWPRRPKSRFVVTLKGSNLRSKMT